MKIINFIKEHAFKILTVIFFILYMSQGCTNKKISKMNKVLSTRIDSLGSVMNTHQLTPEENKKMMEETMWQFLIYEEMSDKDNIPINKLKSDNSGK